MTQYYELKFDDTEKTFRYVEFDNVSFAHKQLLKVPGVIVAGGSCIPYFDRFHSFNDIDVYCSTEEQYDGLVYACEAMGLNNTGFSVESGETCIEEFAAVGARKIQIIRNPLINVGTLLTAFDFACCRVAVSLQDGKYLLHYDEFTEVDIKDKQLRFCHYRSPKKKSFERVLKYYAKGYELMKIRIDDFWKHIDKDFTSNNPKEGLKIDVAESDLRQITSPSVVWYSPSPQSITSSPHSGRTITYTTPNTVLKGTK